MNKRIILFFIALLTFGIMTPGYSMQNIFYILKNSPASLLSLKNHYQAMDAIIAQAYQINEQGEVSGNIDPKVASFANQHHMKVTALVTNIGFNQEKAHSFLTNTSAQQSSIQTLVNLCKQNHYEGLQLDFENIHVSDKNKLTHFYMNAAQALHKQGYAISFAVVPVPEDGPATSSYQKRKYDNWGGVYDLQALGKVADFISIMAYDQHSQGNIPGPTASIRWVNSTIQHALHFIPARKLSLGVPTYSAHWYTAMDHATGRITVHLSDISYAEVKTLLERNRAALRWNKEDKLSYAVYQHAWLNEYIFAEDVNSFKAKERLAKKYKLRSLSIFTLGNEDPRIWDT
jgi:spore germination protein